MTIAVMGKHFTDRELRARLLTYFYDRRKDPLTEINDPGRLMPDGSESEFHRIIGQLADFRLVESDSCRVPLAQGGYVPQHRWVKITSAGIQAVEEQRSDRVALDFSFVQQIVNVTNPSGPVHVGDNNVTIVNAIHLLIEKIDQSNASPSEKVEAKSLIKRMLEHPLTSAVVGGVASSAASAFSG